MSYTIQEKFLQGKTGKDITCEDFIVAAPNVIAVIDGATDKSGREYAGVSSGRFAAQTVAEALPELVKQAATPHELIGAMTLCLQQAIQKELGDADVAGMAMPSLTFLAYLPEDDVILRVGDSPFIIDAKLYGGEMKIDQATSMARACFIELGLLNQDFNEDELYTEDFGRDFIMPLLKKQHLLVNNESSSFGYGVINGSKVARSFIEIFPTNDARHIVLASDGYPDLKPTLEESEHSLKSILEQDPLLFRQHYSTKGLRHDLLSYDDRAYISFTLS